MARRTLPEQILKRARGLRHEMSDAERKLWSVLRAHRLAGRGFRRQAPIGPYFVDFVCHEARLIVEVDGGQHGTDQGIARDDRRTAWLASRGYRVLRFWNNDVLANIDGVARSISDALTQDETVRIPELPSESLE